MNNKDEKERETQLKETWEKGEEPYSECVEAHRAQQGSTLLKAVVSVLISNTLVLSANGEPNHEFPFCHIMCAKHKTVPWRWSSTWPTESQGRQDIHLQKVKQILTVILTMEDGLRIILASGLACTWWAGLGSILSLSPCYQPPLQFVCLIVGQFDSEENIIWLRF